MFLNSIKEFLSYKKYQYINDKRYKLEKNYIKNNEEKTETKMILDNLKKNGYIIIPNFFEKKQCEKIVYEINNFIKNNSKLIWKDAIGSDHRINGAEYISKEINGSLDRLINFTENIGKIYLKQDISLFMVMANRTIQKKNNHGSGNGWHKDSYSRQFKSILYLNDVTKNNGPFQIIKNSTKNLFMFNLFLKLKNKFPNTRFSDEEILKILNNKRDEIIDLIGKAGTLILVDTSNLHRGKPLEFGERYALTNYFYPKIIFDDHKDHFKPKLDNYINS